MPFVSQYDRGFAMTCYRIARENRKNTLSKNPYTSKASLDTTEKVARRIEQKETDK